MFSCVLRHLRRHRPDWENIVAAATGRESALSTLAAVHSGDANLMMSVQFGTYGQTQTRPGLCSNAARVIANGIPHDVVYDHIWPECPLSYADAPSTKAVWCLRELFGLPIDRDLLQYFIAIEPDNRERVDRYLNKLPAKFAVVHYQGTTCAQAKSLSVAEISEACDFLVARGIACVILDWSMMNSLSDGKRIFHPGHSHELWRAAGTGCAQVIAALMERAAVTVCIDSGPGKVALATQTTPALQIWRHMHPIHYCDYAPHAMHLVPGSHLHQIRGDKEIGLQFFNDNYRYALYQENRLGRTIGEFAWRMANRIPLTSKDDDDSIKVYGPKSAAVGKSPMDMLEKAKQTGFVIGIPTLNRYDKLRQLFRNLADSTVRPKIAYVIDNGGGFGEFFKNASPIGVHLRVITPQRNLGVAASWNLLHKLASPLPLILLNDDVEVATDTFARMLACDQPMVTAAGWSAFLQREEVWQTVGEYDEGFYPAYHEDSDMLWRLKLAGMDQFCIDAGVKHEPSQTMKRFTEAEEVEFRLRWQQNHEYFQKKWGGLPGRETFTTAFGKSL